MNLSEKDIKKIVEEMVALMQPPTANKNADKEGVKVAGKPKAVIPAKDRPTLLQNLTINKIVEYWGTLNMENIFSNRYKCSHTLYEKENIEGRPNVRYSEAYKYFIIPIATNNKFTAKQMQELKKSAIGCLEGKIKSQSNPKALEWLNKSLKKSRG